MLKFLKNLLKEKITITDVPKEIISGKVKKRSTSQKCFKILNVTSIT